MSAFLVWLEDTAPSVLIRESPSVWGFPFVLFLHTLGLGVAAGVSVALNLWVLGWAERYPAAPLRGAFPVVWLGFTIALVSGVLLLLAYPTKALTDPVFYLKLTLIVAALAQVQWIRRRLFDADGANEPRPPSAAMRRSAGAALVLWTGAVLTGRLLAYTYNYLTAAELIRGA
ncbi:MAG TPA: hypothetical protein VF339_06105 [Gammaproteobacteria bacterium]